MRRIGWWAMMFPALIIAVYAMGVLFVPAMRPPFLTERFLIMPLAAYMHLAGSGLALAMGAFQLNTGLRSRFINMHRWMGRTYVVGVLLGGTGALALAAKSQAGLVTHVGFGLLALLWLFATAMAYRHIRSGNQAFHRRWMIRSYALTFAAVTLRIYLPLGQLAGLPFDAAYQTISWFAWVPNLIVAEWIILRQRAPAIIPELRTTVASCLLVSMLTAGLSACGERSQQRSETPADSTPSQSPPQAASPPATDVQESLSEYVVHGVCPFKCCHYGSWTSLRGGILRTEPNLSADSVGAITPGAQMRTDSGVMVLHPPGIAVVVSDSAPGSTRPRVGDTVQVLDYVGQGQQISRVRWQGQELQMTGGGLQMVRDPMQEWWVYVTDPATRAAGWMLMGGVSAGEVGALPDSCYRR